MSKITSLDIIGQLERLAEAFPWQEVHVWVKRKPEGEYKFVAYIEPNYQLGTPSDNFTGPSLVGVVDEALATAHKCDPEMMRVRKIEELKEQIATLQSLVLGLPPYRPNRELSNGEPAIKTPDTIEASATVTA